MSNTPDTPPDGAPIPPALRDRFDRLLERVIADLPAHLQALLDETPVIVDNWAPAALAAEVDVEDRRDLCGLYDGIPLTDRSVLDSGILPGAIRLYRGAIMEEAAAAGSRGRSRLSDADLRREIRLTLLHEMGHHFGLSEEDLREAGYE